MNVQKIERAKNAMQQLTEAQGLITLAYNQLLADGIPERTVKAICKTFYNEAIPKPTKTEDQATEE